MELERSYDSLKEQGLGVVAISYDSVEILQDFSQRKGPFRYTLLADPESKVIESFGLRNPYTKAGTILHGVAFPGTYIVDENGVVQQKFFNNSYRQRLTTETVLLKSFGAGEGGQRVEADIKRQFQVTAYPSQDEIRPGNRILLMAEFDLYDKVHLYAPGSSYRAVDIQIADHPAIKAGALDLPEPEMIYLDVIDETVPVYYGKVRIDKEITLSPNFKGDSIDLTATLRYQTCDDELCFPPAELPLSFKLAVIPLDTTRASDEVKHPGGFR